MPRDKEDCSCSAQKESREDSALVADTLHQTPRDQRCNEVAAEKSDLNERGLKIAQAEGRFEMGNENVVEIYPEGPKEK
jgi:hypothetical protein